MTKRLAEAAFEIMSQGRAKDAKRARPMLDTIAIENALTDVLEHIEVVSDHVEFMTLRYDSLINHLADYVGQDLGELWTQNENTKPIDFMNGIENDVEALLSKSSEWRCQDGLGHLTASWLKVFRGVSDDVLTGWLRQKAPSGKTFSDSLYQAIEIVREVVRDNRSEPDESDESGGSSSDEHEEEDRMDGPISSTHISDEAETENDVVAQ